ncbi:uncharacterized protein LOC8288479 [Ricinus communis]|uniref:uncharacterized protein LOC8288479 n=1 Tax=Ricinus communis TaxID=3988 RepID=UPI00201A4F5E|nr:uncharacterized protein LOC8288479 [Ricinus communis]
MTMECNKEEAFRAKELAEKKMQNGDYVAARRIALKARQLYPDLDNISQLLMVCEVHCSAQNKLNGSEMDWYGILQIEKFSDEAVIKKQFRKLALSLHPDKNKFSGAEAAFKLIGEANRVLTDPSKRPAYDMKCRGTFKPVAPKPPSEQSNKNVFVNKQNGAAKKFSNAPQTQYTSSHANQQPTQQTFWTVCPSCNVRFQYFRDLLKKLLRCQSCHQPFIAHELFTPSGSTWNHFMNEKRVPNHGSSKAFPQNYAGKPSGMSFPHRFSGSDPMPHVGKATDVGGNKPKEVKVENATGIGRVTIQQRKVNGHVDVKAENGGVPVSMPDAMKPKESGNSESATNKRCRNSVEESSKNFDKGSIVGSEENVVREENGGDPSAQNSGSSVGHQSRRSLRQKQHISYKDNSDEDDFVAPPPKRSRGNSSSNVNDVQTKAGTVDGGVPKEDVSAGSAASVLNRNSKAVKRKANSSFDERQLNQNRESGGSKAEGEEASMPERAGTKSENDDERLKTDTSELDLKPKIFVCADADFSNFEKERAEVSFAVNQVWAIYDSHDGMPRFYARIRKVFRPGFKLQITWLESIVDGEAEQKWCDEGLPVGCGSYEYGETEETVDRLMFSHKMDCMSGGLRGTFCIYPKKGETWALFKDWDAKWSLEPEKHRPPYQFEFVEVLTDFTKDAGIEVACLGKVKGFVSIFQQANCDEVLSFCIRPSELYRFSHRVPSVRMSGKEGEGVPACSFECDTAALPSNLVTLVDTENIFKNTGTGPRKGTSILGSSPSESIGRCKDDNQGDACQQEVDSNKVASRGKVTQSSINTYFQAREKILTDKKREEGKFVAVSLTPRRSPRDLSKRINQVSRSQSTIEDINKHMEINRDCKDGHPGISSGQLDDKLHLHRNDGIFASPMKGRSSSGCKVIEVDGYDFRKEKSEDKFRSGQIWAVHSDKDGLPRNYVQVKKIETGTGFRLHVAMLETCTLQKDRRQPASCGTFRVKNGNSKVLLINAFSHKVKAKSTGRNTYEIFPRKGEIWAVYKSLHSEVSCSDQGTGECDIVEVIEDNSRGVKVVVLMPGKGQDTLYMSPTSKRLKSSIMDIPRTEFARFSHQCLAHKHAEENDSRLRGYWQLDPPSIPGNVILVE